MFLNKTTLLALCTLFVISGCITTNNDEQKAQQATCDVASNKIHITTNNDEQKAQQAKLTTLQGELVKETEKNKQLQTELKTSQDKVTTLNALVKKKQKVMVEKQKTATKLNDKTILGQSEWVYVSKVKSNYKGRIDTGATTSSISALDIERFERDGVKWVRFNLTHDKSDEKQMVEAKVIRIAKITQSSRPGVKTERPVVNLHIRIGDIAYQTEFTLTDRLHMEYPILIGRTFIQDVILVDVSQEYIHPKYKAKTK